MLFLLAAMTYVNTLEGAPGLPGAARLALRRRFLPARHYGFFLRRAELRGFSPPVDLESEAFNLRDHYKPAVKPFDIFISMKRVEWDTLMFFYGVMLCVGGLGALGYLALVSDFLYADLGPAAGIWTHLSVNAALL